MIFRNTFRLLVTNFSNVWKLLLYFVICISVSLLFCGVLAYPIIKELSEANVFSDLLSLINNFFTTTPVATARTFEEVNETIVTIMTESQFTFNYIFLGVFVFFIVPLAFELAQLPMGEVIYGYMASQTKYSFSSRYFRSFGSSIKFSLTKYLVTVLFNLVSVLLIYCMVHLASLGNILYYFLDIIILGILVAFVSFKQTLFACFMPSIAVLQIGPFKALGQNFKYVFKKFGSIFSTSILLVLLSFAFNLIFCVFTLTIGLIVTIPLTVLVFVIFQMVSFFSAQGGRYYVYTDTLVSPKTFEEQIDIESIKYLI